jgi:hypothetical protein
MRTHVEFRSDAFPAEAGENEAVNPGRWGKQLAVFLRSEFDRAGLKGGDVVAEDWGWVVPIENEAFSLWVGCGNYEEYPDGFLCFIEPSKPAVRRGLFSKVDTTARVAEIASALDRILTARSDIRDLRWWSESEAAT